MPFVNFTLNDSRILLSGVAPSGTLKTKAKRDQQELKTKRRRLLAEAALCAVEKAGGSLEALEEAMLGS